MHVYATKRMTFEAAHFLEGYPGKCAFIHGHSYTLDVTCTSSLGDPGIELMVVPDGPHKGMVGDFVVIKAALQKLIDWLDHSLLTEKGLPSDMGVSMAPSGNSGSLERVRVLGFRPTTELLAAWIFREVEIAFAEAGLDWLVLERIRLTETATGWVDVCKCPLANVSGDEGA